jgi:hypothetical protein
MPDHSQDTLTQKIAESTTFASKALLVNMDAQSEQSSRLETQTVQETVKIQKMFPDGKFPLNCFFPFTTTKPQHIQFHQIVINDTLRIEQIHRCLITLKTHSPHTYCKTIKHLNQTPFFSPTIQYYPRKPHQDILNNSAISNHIFYLFLFCF